MSHSSTNGVANFLAKSMIDLEFGFMGFFAIMQYISSLFFFFFCAFKNTSPILFIVKHFIFNKGGVSEKKKTIKKPMAI